MACDEITKAIDWAKKTHMNEIYPVTAYFTKHDGILTDPNAPPPSGGRDFCWYAVGRVNYVAPSAQPEHLAGTITLYLNNAASDGMQTKPGSGLAVQIFDDGTVTYQQQLNGKPVGGMPPHTVKTTCIGGVLLSGTEDKNVITVGVRLDGKEILPK